MIKQENQSQDRHVITFLYSFLEPGIGQLQLLPSHREPPTGHMRELTWQIIDVNLATNSTII